MGIAKVKGENKIEYQDIGTPISNGSFIRLAAESDGNCFFSSLLMTIRSKNMTQLSGYDKIEFTRLFREFYLTPETIERLKVNAKEFLQSLTSNSSANTIAAQEIQVEDAFTNLEKDKQFTDMLVSMLICQDLGYSPIFLNATNDDPRVPMIPREQCIYNIKDGEKIIIFMFYGQHFEPVNFLRGSEIIRIFNPTSEEIKPILELLKTSCETLAIANAQEENAQLAAAFAASLIPEQNANLEAALAASLLEGAEGNKEQEAVGGGGSAAAAPAPAPAPAAAAVKTLAAPLASQAKAQEVEGIVAAFVTKNTETWKKTTQHFLHKSAKHTTSSRPLEEIFKNPLIPMEGFLVKTCRGTNNDCIINSLLTCLSPTFRRLEGTFKDKVASYYRYEHLLPMYSRFIKATVLQTSDDKSIKKAVSIQREIASGIDKYKIDRKKVVTTGYGGRPISAEVAAAFGITHGISVLIKESEAREQGAFTLLGPQPAAPSFIIIHNMGGVHYSSISDSADTYVFNTDMIRPWIAASETKGHKETKTKCPFVTNQVLTRNGKVYIVVSAENTNDNTECKHVYIHELGGDVNGYIKDIQNILLIEKASHPPTPIDPTDAEFNFDVEQAKAVEWQGVEAGANRAFGELNAKYRIFKKKYASWDEVFQATNQLPFINIKGQAGYELANPNVHDAYGIPSTYLEYMTALSSSSSSSGAAAAAGGGALVPSGSRRTRRRKNLTSTPY